MKKIKKLFVILIIFCILPCSAFSYEASDMTDNLFIENTFVTVIIETYNSDAYLYENIYNDIKKISGNVSSINHVYTDVFHGFSLSIECKYIEDIKNLENVKNVYICEEYKVPEINELESFNSNIMTFSLNTENYSGKGTIIAVLDTEFLLNHSVFTPLSDESSAKVTKDDMAAIYAENTLNSEVYDSAINYESTWYNTKIPYYYDYGEKDTITSATVGYHGTSVASLIGGNNTTVTGTAPEAQLALFKVSNSSGAIFEDVILAALDDAYKMKVDAVNMSFGDATGFVNEWSQNDAFNFSVISEKFKKAGIPLFIAGGNNSNAGNIKYNGRYYSLTSNPDFGTMSSFASQKDVVSAGALDGSPNSGITNPTVADYSTVGATNDLRIAPDLTYFGNPTVAQPDSINSYTSSARGTSLSTPLLCGIYASCKQYYKEKYPLMTETELNYLIEQAMMSTANPVKDNGVPVSPRLQGAGYPELNDIINTPIVLIGSDNKSKINLYDTTANTLEISFKAKNYSENEITYDLSGELITDNYLSLNGEYINLMTPNLIENAEFIFDTGKTITIKANEEKVINATVTIPQDIIGEYAPVFKNGFFIEGFIYLKSEDSSLPGLSIPFMAFKGEWDKAPVFDEKNVYGLFGFYYKNKTLLNESNSKVTYLNPDTSVLRMGVLRNIKNFGFVVKQDDNILASRYGTNLFRKNYFYNGSFIYSYTNLNSISGVVLSEGDYTIDYYGDIEYNNAETQTFSQNIIVDKTAPEILSVKRTVSNNKVYLNIEVKDNYKINELVIKKYIGDIAQEDVKTFIINSETEVTYKYDITDEQLYTYHITAYDSALNSSYYTEDISNYISYIAGYNLQGSLSDIIIKPGVLSMENALSEAKDFNAEKIIYYIWDSLMPVIKPIQLK